MSTDGSALRIPADAAYVGTARIFAAALARMAGVPEDQIDDLKLAISEACAVGVREEGEGWIVVRAVPDRSRIAFEVVGEDIPPPPTDDLVATPESFRRTMGFDVIRSLFPEASFPSDDDGSGRIEFTINIES